MVGEAQSGSLQKLAMNLNGGKKKDSGDSFTLYIYEWNAV